MAQLVRMDALKSVVEAAGVAMAPAADQFEGEPDVLIVDIGAQVPTVSMDAGNYSRSWARPLFRDTFPQSSEKPGLLRLLFQGRRARVVPT